MEFITKIFEFDFATLVPDLPALLQNTFRLVSIVIFLGPVLLLLLGLFYLIAPPKEANHRMGFRTYFGMGSVEAWRYTQRIAGLIYSALGAALLLVAVVVAVTFIGKDHYHRINSAAACLAVQAVLAILGRLTVSILAAVYFDKNGDRRR